MTIYGKEHWGAVCCVDGSDSKKWAYFGPYEGVIPDQDSVMGGTRGRSEIPNFTQEILSLLRCTLVHSHNVVKEFKRFGANVESSVGNSNLSEADVENFQNNPAYPVNIEAVSDDNISDYVNEYFVPQAHPVQ